MTTAQLHDGTTLEFPDGTDPAVVQATVKRVLASRQQAPATAQGAPTPAPVGGGAQPQPSAQPEGVLNADGSSPLLDRLKYGLAGVGVQGYLGAKNLFGKLSPEEENVLAQSKADVEHSGFAGKAANFVGNLGAGVAATALAPEVAVPAALAKFPTLLGAAKAALGSGAMEGVTAPAEDQDNIALSKAIQAGKAAVAGPLAYFGGKAVQKGATGLFSATKDAMDLMAQGINPTLQAAADSGFGRWVGGLTAGINKPSTRIEQETLDALTQRASGGKIAAPGSTLNQRVGQLQASIDQDTADLMKGKRFPLTQAVRNDMLQQADNIKGPQGQQVLQQGRARDILDNILGELPGARPRMGWQDMQDQYVSKLDNAISSARDPDVAQALSNARDVLTSSMEAKLKPDELAKLRDIQSRGYDVDRLTDLTAGRGGEGSGLKIGKLADVYGNAPDAATNATNQELVGPLIRTMGATPRQDEAITLRRIVNQGLQGAGLGAIGHLTGTSPALVPLYALSLAGQTGRGVRMLTGQTGPQQALKAALESPQTGEISAANAFRALRDNASAVGSALVGN